MRRCEIFGNYIVETGCTVREAAKEFDISKSTIHNSVTKTLKNTNKSLYKAVRKVLDKNKAERHLRGGEATKKVLFERKQKKQGGDKK